MVTKCPYCRSSFEADDAWESAICPRCQATFDPILDAETEDCKPAAKVGRSDRIGVADPAYNAVGKHLHEYVILELLGQGGMGVVYKALQETLDRVVALKMIRPGEAIGPQAIARFRSEAKAGAKLRHPNIVRIHELDVYEGTIYYTMDFIPGESLDRILLGGALNPRRAAAIAMKVARALGYAHRRGLVHRDLKPGNLMVEGDSEPRITDFGLAFDRDWMKVDAARAAVAGTPLYMAPEQVMGREGRGTSPACDLYALGAVLYEMLTGQPPHHGLDRDELFRAILEDAPVPPNGVRPGLDPELSAICMKCLEKQPEHRWSSADHLARTLVRWLRPQATRGARRVQGE